MAPTKTEMDFLGIPIEIHIVSGTVLDASAHTATQVTSTRNAAGTVSAIQSYNETVQEFWIRVEAGQEIPIATRAAPIAVRSGQQVVIYRANGKGSEASSIVGIKNLTTGQYVLTMNRHQKMQVSPSIFSMSLLSQLGAGLVTLLLFLISPILGALLSLIHVGIFGVNAIVIATLSFVGAYWQHLYSMGRFKRFQRDLCRFIETGQYT